MSEALLSVEGLSVDFRSGGLGRRSFRAVDDASFHIDRGETLGLVGESGSGKSTIGRAILGLAPVSEGSIRFRGQDITHLSRAQRRKSAGGIQVVFQDPYSSLNPSMTIGEILAEPLVARGDRRTGAMEKISTLLRQVGLPADARSRYPRQFSGGQRQRIAIARALALEPELIVCDEPVSAHTMSSGSRASARAIAIRCRCPPLN